MVVKGSVTEEWFSGVLRSFFRVGFDESSEKTGWAQFQGGGREKGL